MDIQDSTLQHLREVRHSLLRLHKALLDSERTTYEQNYGRIQSNSEFFQLVIRHEWFNWLRPISQFIVQIDETLEAEEPIEQSKINELFGHAKTLLRASEAGTPAEQRYDQAIQRDPDIAFMHAELSNLLAKA
ncbi:MAG: hypothetical protein HC866_16855 [Leptolyngbyaceae cyanobacterium RU_5_1]|nr:hypothetical protein [Leptolyngbyaceae cyanobacterium RU_5_1]